MIIKKCIICNKKYKVKPYRKNIQRYCSLYCYHISTRNKPTWNKGLHTGIVPKTAFKKGIRNNIDFEFKLGHGKSFSGTKKEYKFLHYWVNKNLGKSYVCSMCNSTNNVEWANKSHFYKKELNDWIQLCKKCHYKYDHL